MKQKLRSIAGSIIIGGVLLTCIGIAFADNTGADTSTGQKPGLNQAGGRNPGGMGGSMGEGRQRSAMQGGMQNLSEEVIAGLVEEGIISQAIADKMTSFIEEESAERKAGMESAQDMTEEERKAKDEERKAEMEKVQSMTEEERKAYFESRKSTDAKPQGKSDSLSAMVEEGILTQDQAEAIKEYLEEQGQAKQEEQQQEQLEAYVDEGLITEEQKEAILAYYKEEEKDREAEMEKVKAMTQEERKAYSESKKDGNAEGEKREERPDRLKGLVDAGILTQDEADAINEYQQAQMKEKMAEAQAKREEEQKERLDSLVDDGTITEAQAEEIITYLEEQEESRKAEMEKTKALTEEERKAYLESRKETGSEDKPGPLKELVDAGILTQDEADAVAKVLFQQRPGPGGPTASQN